MLNAARRLSSTYTTIMRSKGNDNEEGVPKSSAAAKHSEGYSNPSETNVATGRFKLNLSLRSIVMSRAAFSLFHGFNPVETNIFRIGDIVETPSEPTERPNFTKSRENDNILSACFKKSTQETTITKDMGIQLRKVCDNKFASVKLTTIVEAEVPAEAGKKKKPPRLDVACGERIGGCLVGFVEVGLTNRDVSTESEPEKIDQLFWKKVDQAIHYLHLLSKNGVDGSDEDGEAFELHAKDKNTLLLCVIVMNRKRTFGRIAIFACEPKRGDGDGAWRMALMWRKEGDAATISRAFGFYISSIQFMAENNFNLDPDDEKWVYMGPNCSKVTVQDSNGQVCEQFWCGSGTVRPKKHTTEFCFRFLRHIPTFFAHTTTVFVRQVVRLSCTTTGRRSSPTRHALLSGKKMTQTTLPLNSKTGNICSSQLSFVPMECAAKSK